MTSTYYVDLHYNIIANFQYQGTDENAKEVYEYIAEKNNLLINISDNFGERKLRRFR